MDSYFRRIANDAFYAYGAMEPIHLAIFSVSVVLIGYLLLRGNW